KPRAVASPEKISRSTCRWRSSARRASSTSSARLKCRARPRTRRLSQEARRLPNQSRLRQPRRGAVTWTSLRCASRTSGSSCMSLLPRRAFRTMGGLVYLSRGPAERKRANQPPEPCEDVPVMPKVVFVNEKQELDVPAGANLRQEARKAGLELYPG